MKSSLPDSTTIDGYEFDVYQTTNMGTNETPNMYIGLFCHTCGHAICGYWDLYDYGYDSAGIGNYGLMSSGNWGNGGYNPMAINGYFRWISGWEKPIFIHGNVDSQEFTIHSRDMQATSTITENWDSFPENEGNLFVVLNENNPYEFLVIENIYQSGRKSTSPSSGLAIWHIDESKGGYMANDEQDMTPERHYFMSLEQADGNFDLERNLNNGDSDDLFCAPNYTAYSSEPSTDPNSPAVSSAWWSGKKSGFEIYDISGPGSVMTFKVHFTGGLVGYNKFTSLAQNWGESFTYTTDPNDVYTTPPTKPTQAKNDYCVDGVIDVEDLVRLADFWLTDAVEYRKP